MPRTVPGFSAPIVMARSMSLFSVASPLALLPNRRTSATYCVVFAHRGIARNCSGVSFAGVRQRGYAPCDLFLATRTQHSRLGPSWSWHERIPRVRSPDAFKRSDSLSARQVGRHGEDEGCHQWT